MNRLAPSTAIRFQQECQKRLGSASYDRYNKYKGAGTVEAALSLGACRGDLLWDFKAGYLVITNKKLHASLEDSLKKRDREIKKRSTAAKKHVTEKRDRKQAIANIVKKPASKMKVRPVAPLPKTKIKKAMTQRAVKTSAMCGMPSFSESYVKDAPLPDNEGDGGQAVWKEMVAAGWRRCEFKYLDGLRRGAPYTRFVKPPPAENGMPSTSMHPQPPVGASINGGFDAAIRLYAEAQGLSAEALLRRRSESRTVGQERNEELKRVREDAVKAYRTKYGRLDGPESLHERHPGWHEDPAGYTSPDGQRFSKDKCTLNKDLEAYLGSQL